MAYLDIPDRHTDCCQNLTCIQCGSPVSVYNCNQSFYEQRPTAELSDWWVICNSEACVHHFGEDLFQNMPDWVVEA
jgi:hypothetical protein